MTLRQVEEVTGIHNAHLSQIETGTIVRPRQVMLWSIAEALDLDYAYLLKLAGHTTTDRTAQSQRQLAGALLRGLEDLDETEQQEMLAQLERLRKKKR